MKYADIGKYIQLTHDSVKVDTDFANTYGLSIDGDLTRQDGIDLFNKVAESNGLHPIKDPKGYMKLDNNIYDAIQSTYTDKYEEAIDRVRHGMVRGGEYAMKSVLNKQLKTVRADFKNYIPDDIHYSDLKYIENTPLIQTTIDSYVDARVRLTYSYNIRRSVEDATFESINQDMGNAGMHFKELVTNEISHSNAPDVLSKQTLLANSNNNVAGLDAFSVQLTNPDTISKNDDSSNAIASFKTSDKNVAKFLIMNKDYLSRFGFDITKSRGEITTSWSSKQVETLYNDRNATDIDAAVNDIDFSGLDGTLEM